MTLAICQVEGGHRVLKARLKFSTGDLSAVVEHIEEFINTQHEDYMTSLAKEEMKKAWNLLSESFKELVYKVSPYALQKIRKQWKISQRAARDPVSHTIKPCTQAFNTTIGLLCSYTIQADLETTGRSNSNKSDRN